MELNATQKDFAKALGISEATLSAVIEANDDADGTKLGTSALEVIETNLTSKLKPEIEDAATASAFAATIKKNIRALGKKFNLGLSSAEMDKLKFDEVTELIEAKITEAANSGDEALAAKLAETNTKLTDTIDAYESKITDLNSSWETKVNEKSSELQNYKTERLFESVFDEVTFGVSKAHIPKWKKDIIAEVTAKYNIDDNFNLTAKDGGGAALNFEGDTKVTHLKEPVAELMIKWDLNKKSGGEDDPRAGDNKSRTTGGDTSQVKGFGGFSSLKEKA